MDAICIALGGLGSSFDQLALNHEMLQKHGVKLKVRVPCYIYANALDLT
jgi:hypothetical protein